MAKRGRVRNSRAIYAQKSELAGTDKLQKLTTSDGVVVEDLSDDQEAWLAARRQEMARETEGIRLLGDLERRERLHARAMARQELDRRRAVAAARAVGVSWARLGAAMSMTGEAVRKRYGQ